MFNNIDRESFDIAVQSKEEVIHCLEAKVAWLEKELDIQRKRADIAIDRLLSIQKIPSVMPENFLFPTAKENRDVTEQIKAMELMKSEMESIGEISEDEPEPGVVTELN